MKKTNSAGKKSSKNFKPKSKKSVLNTKKNSTGQDSQKVLSILTKMLRERAGSVSFVLESTRIDLRQEPPKEYSKKAYFNVKLTEKFFEGKRPNDLIYFFETMMNDYNAKRYILT